MSASQRKLSALHEKLADRMSELLDKEELTAAEMTAVANFLKHNDVRSSPETDDRTRELQEKFARRAVAPDLVDFEAAFEDSAHLRGTH